MVLFEWKGFIVTAASCLQIHYAWLFKMTEDLFLGRCRLQSSAATFHLCSLLKEQLIGRAQIHAILCSSHKKQKSGDEIKYVSDCHSQHKLPHFSVPLSSTSTSVEAQGILRLFPFKCIYELVEAKKTLHILTTTLKLFTNEPKKVI